MQPNLSYSRCVELGISTVGGKYSATDILIALPLRSPFQCCLRSMPKAVPRNSRAIVVQLVTNIETGNEKGYGHFSCRIFSAYGPEFPLISSSNDGIMLRNIFRLPLGRLFYCICPMSLLGFLVAGIACTIACVGALFCCRIFSVRRHLCMWRSLCCSNRNPS